MASTNKYQKHLVSDLDYTLNLGVSDENPTPYLQEGEIVTAASCSVISPVETNGLSIIDPPGVTFTDTTITVFFEKGVVGHTYLVRIEFSTNVTPRHDARDIYITIIPQDL